MQALKERPSPRALLSLLLSLMKPPRPQPLLWSPARLEPQTLPPWTAHHLPILDPPAPPHVKVDLRLRCLQLLDGNGNPGMICHSEIMPDRPLPPRRPPASCRKRPPPFLVVSSILESALAFDLTNLYLQCFWFHEIIFFRFDGFWPQAEKQPPRLLNCRLQFFCWKQEYPIQEAQNNLSYLGNA